MTSTVGYSPSFGEGEFSEVPYSPGGCYATDMKRDAAFWWAVAATISYGIIIMFMVVFVFAMWAQFTAGLGPAD